MKRKSRRIRWERCGERAALIGVVAAVMLLSSVVAETEGFHDLPAALVADDFAPLLSASPFSRVLDPKETYAFRGFASFDDIHFATLYNRETKKTFLVSLKEENEEGLQLIDILLEPDVAPDPGKELETVTARVSFGGEIVDLKYEPEQLSPRPPGSSGRGGGRERDGGDRERRGPSREDIERYRSLSEENQNKLRQYIGHLVRSYPEMSRAERGNMIRGAAVRLADGRDLDIPAASAGGATGAGERSRGGAEVRTRSSSGEGSRRGR